MSKKRSEILISCIIPAKDKDNPKLADLIQSIKAQDFPQDKIEILVITEGTAESAKAIGIRKAQGKICAMFCDDNLIVDCTLFTRVYQYFKDSNASAIYPAYYYRRKDDNSLNRYFALIGCNDPLAYYLKKQDRLPHFLDVRDYHPNGIPTYGENGFFYRKVALLDSDLDHYFHIDNASDLIKKGYKFYCLHEAPIWHRTSDSLISFLKKRYRYARDLYCDSNDRRWSMLSTKEDYRRLALFILATLTVVQPLLVALRGYRSVRDWAWFWHPIVCAGFLITYTTLALRNLLKHGRIFQCR